MIGSAGAGVVSVRANGVLAETDDAFASWSAALALVEGENEIEIVAEGPGEARTVRRLRIERRPTSLFELGDLASAAGSHELFAVAADLLVAIDPATGTRRIVARWDRDDAYLHGLASDGTSLYSVDDAHGEVVALDPATGARRVVSATGARLWSTRGLACDPERGRLLVTDYARQQVIAVSLADGARSVLASVGAASAIEVVPGQRDALVAGGAAISTLDLETGAVTLLSDATHGEGPALGYVHDFLQLPGASHALVLTGRRLVRVETSGARRGDRTTISDVERGAGPSLGYATAMRADPARPGVVWVLDVDLDAIVEIDVASGDRRIVSREGFGEGPALGTASGDLVIAQARAFMTSGHRVVSIDLETGDRDEIVLFDEAALYPSLFGGLHVEDEGDRAWATAMRADGVGALLEIDLSTGVFHVVSDGESPRQGEPLARTWAMALDEARRRALIVDGDALIAAHTSTGERSVVSSGERGRGPLVAWADDVELARDGSRAWLAAPVEEVVLEIDVESGDRRVVSGPEVGEGPPLMYPTGVIADAVTGALWVVVPTSLGDAYGLYRVDLASGARTHVSGAAHGAGPSDYGATDIAHDGVPGRVYVTTPYALNALLAIDTTYGQRVIVSK
ncbi:PQQ-binding-like beta-propeller repeat protein [Sandaracinus amylolyticus]|uniref:outer membrane protein assembly factor BamB family protein n=1 Tax=Sandaracinus amylolyticus TaxID=927083 RepID=UPI001F4033C9|nr:PQQ-binding-like beta-propeller repeat protein [Sandaracinus amylolyticus]